MSTTGSRRYNSETAEVRPPLSGTAVLTCGHPIGVEEAAALDPDEEVWCSDCGADFAVASAEFLEAHDAAPSLVAEAWDREAHVAATPNPAASAPEAPTLRTAEPQYHNGYGPITVVARGEPTSFSGVAYSVAIDLPDSGRWIDVDVYGPSRSFGAEIGPEVNWPSIGSTNPTDVATFAALLDFAAKAAPTAEGHTA